MYLRKVQLWDGVAATAVTATLNGSSVSKYLIEFFLYFEYSGRYKMSLT